MNKENILTDFMDTDVRQKIVTDENLEEIKKTEVLTACKPASNEDEVENLFNAYACQNRLVGLKAVVMSSAQFVGHIKTIDSVSWYLAKTLNQLPERAVDYTEREIVEHIRALALPGQPLRKREALLWFEEEVFDVLPTYTISSEPSWLFEDDGGDARTPLGSSENSSLPCRLGLPEPKLWGDPPYHYPRGIEFVGFAFPGDTVKDARRPTALDGDYDSVKKIWIIGGRTQPLPHGPDEMIEKGGLLEIVSEAVNLSKCIQNVYVFEN